MGKTHRECGQFRPVEGGHGEQRRELEEASPESAFLFLCFLAGHGVKSSPQAQIPDVTCSAQMHTARQPWTLGTPLETKSKETVSASSCFCSESVKGIQMVVTTLGIVPGSHRKIRVVQPKPRSWPNGAEHVSSVGKGGGFS